MALKDWKKVRKWDSKGEAFQNKITGVWIQISSITTP